MRKKWQIKMLNKSGRRLSWFEERAESSGRVPDRNLLRWWTSCKKNKLQRKMWKKNPEVYTPSSNPTHSEDDFFIQENVRLFCHNKHMNK